MPSENDSIGVERLQIEETQARKRANGTAGSGHTVVPPPLPEPPALIADAYQNPSPPFVPDLTPRPAPKSDPSVQVNRMIMASLESVGFIIFPRVLLMLALVGSFALGVMAMGRQSDIGLEILIAFTALTVAPLAWLERMSRKG